MVVDGVEGENAAGDVSVAEESEGDHVGVEVFEELEGGACF